mgnify:CR=1 FL=1
MKDLTQNEVEEMVEDTLVQLEAYSKGGLTEAEEETVDGATD